MLKLGKQLEIFHVNWLNIFSHQQYRINNLKDFEIKMSTAIIFLGKDDVDPVFLGTTVMQLMQLDVDLGPGLPVRL